MGEVAFDYLQHLVTVPVSVAGVETRFVLDSGIGLTLVRRTLCEELGCRRTGATYTGRRMSGQPVTLPLALAPSLSFAGSTADDVEIGVFDMSGFPPALDHISGFLSLAFFADRAFTVDYRGGTVVVETAETFAQRYAAGVALDVAVEREGPAITVFVSLTIPGGHPVSVEVDMGSDALILDERFAAVTGAALSGDGVRRVEGTDETGHPYVRTFTRLPGAIHPSGAPQLSQAGPEVVVTFDVPSSRLVLGPG